jgi:glycosyl transferase family 25
MIEARVINLESGTDRLKFQEEQLSRLGIRWSRIDATNINQIDPSESIWETWERPLRQTEMACFMSHQKSWQQVADTKMPLLILEDDVLLHCSTRSFLKNVYLSSNDKSVDHITLEIRGRAKFLYRENHTWLPIRRLFQDRTGAAAYILFPSGASKLLRASNKKAAIADAFISNLRSLKSWQCYPGLAMQIDQCSNYGFSSPMETHSQIDQDVRPRQRSAVQHIRRINFQLKLAIAHLNPRVNKAPVPPTPGDWTKKFGKE